METVNDYNPLMKDFPLNDLLSATELDKIRQALVAIFTHLRKIRNTKYPIQRALRLVEAISRDLSSQLLKVLGTRKLMHVAYEEFEKARLPVLFNYPFVQLSTCAAFLQSVMAVQFAKLSSHFHHLLLYVSVAPFFI